jgi:4a-hydroxytetrahydrobiopterin dehydratase
MKIQKLNSEEITQALKTTSGWILEPDEAFMHKQWQFDTFKTAMDFITEVADIAERQNHHPEFLSVYRKMRVRLSTHDASGLTQKDFDLATAIDSLIASKFSHRIQ